MAEMRMISCCGVREIWGLGDLAPKDLEAWTLKGQGLSAAAAVTYDALGVCGHQKWTTQCGNAACKKKTKALSDELRAAHKEALAKSKQGAYEPRHVRGGFGMIMATATDQQKDEQKKLKKMGFLPVARFYNPNTNNNVTVFYKIVTREEPIMELPPEVVKPTTKRKSLSAL